MEDATMGGIVSEIIHGPGWTPGRPGPCWSPKAILTLVWGEHALQELEAVGYLEEWQDAPRGVGVTLSAWCAALFEVELDEVDYLEVPVWVPEGSAARPVHVPRHSRLPDPFPLPPPSPVHRNERKPVIDKVSGEILRLFRGPSGDGAGVTVMVDNRLRQLEAARRRRRPGRTVLG
jgi:hypothetical protein